MPAFGILQALLGLLCGAHQKAYAHHTAARRRAEVSKKTARRFLELYSRLGRIASFRQIWHGMVVPFDSFVFQFIFGLVYDLPWVFHRLSSSSQVDDEFLFFAELDPGEFGKSGVKVRGVNQIGSY